MESRPSSKIPSASSSSSSNKPRPTLEFNSTNNTITNKSSPSPTSTSTSSFKLRKSMTLNNKTHKHDQVENTNGITNSMTNVHIKKNNRTNVVVTNVNEEVPMSSRFSKPRSIYVNENFDDFLLQNELNTNKLNETIVKSVKKDESQQSSPGSNSQGFSGEKASSLASSTSSKIKITSYTLNHQNQIELQQQLKNSTNKSINRLAYSKSSSSKNNLGTANSNSKSKLAVNIAENSTISTVNSNSKSNVKLCRVIKTDQTPMKKHDEKFKNSIFISSASTLLSNNNDTPPNEENILNSLDFIKNATNLKHNLNHNHVNNETFTEHQHLHTRVSSRDSSTKIIDSMASFIEELKDFVDDRLNDTTSQLEMANQRITGLYECFNFVAGEFSLLKFQNDELLKELKQYYQTYGVNKFNDDCYEKRGVKKSNGINGKTHKPNGKKSSETSSAISSFPIKSNRKSKKVYSNRKHELSYSTTDTNSEFSSQNVSLKSSHSSSIRPQSYKNFIVDSKTFNKKLEIKQNEPNVDIQQVQNNRDLKSSLGIRENRTIQYSDIKTRLNNSVNKASFNHYNENTNEKSNKTNKSWLENFDTKLIANEIRTSSQIDLDLMDDDAKLNVLKRNNFVSTELPSDDQIYDGNASDRNNFFDENALNSNELDSNDLASSIENFVEGDGEEQEEGEEEVEIERIYSAHNEIRNEQLNMSKEENSTKTHVNDIRVEIIGKETLGDSNGKNKPDNNRIEMNGETNEIELPNIIKKVDANIEQKDISQLNTLLGPKVVHHIHTSIAPFQSTLMNDFDNQYLWDYSDNNKFQKF